MNVTSIRSWWLAAAEKSSGGASPGGALNRGADKAQPGHRLGSASASSQGTFWSDFARRREESPLAQVQGRAVKPLSILVPTDFADTSLLALDCALRMAAQQEAHITLLHAIHLNLFPGGPANVASLKTDLCREALVKAEPILAAAKDLGVSAVCMLEEGPPAKAIASVVRVCAPDLVILAAARRGFLARLFGRGTVKKVIQSVKCPVLVLPAA